MKTITTKQGGEFRVSDAAYERVKMWRWHTQRNGYAVRTVHGFTGYKTIYLHREVIDAPHGFEVDHIDGDKTNCQDSNLRVCTRRQNGMNQHKQRQRTTSRYKGVYWRKDIDRWQAQIKTDDRRVFLGFFDDEIEAARAYDKAAIQHFGQFARLNGV